MSYTTRECYNTKPNTMETDGIYWVVYKNSKFSRILKSETCNILKLVSKKEKTFEFESFGDERTVFINIEDIDKFIQIYCPFKIDLKTK